MQKGWLGCKQRSPWKFKGAEHRKQRRGDRAAEYSSRHLILPGAEPAQLPRNLMGGNLGLNLILGSSPNLRGEGKLVLNAHIS